MSRSEGRQTRRLLRLYGAARSRVINPSSLPEKTILCMIFKTAHTLCSPLYLVMICQVTRNTRDKLIFHICSLFRYSITHSYIFITRGPGFLNLTKHNVVVCDPVTRHNYTFKLILKSQFKYLYLMKPAFLVYGVNKQDSRQLGKEDLYQVMRIA